MGWAPIHPTSFRGATRRRRVARTQPAKGRPEQTPYHRAASAQLRRCIHMALRISRAALSIAAALSHWLPRGHSAPQSVPQL